jgi:hypothetical protein
LVVDQAPIKIKILIKLAPFFMRIAAKGNAPYSGPAAKDPRRKARMLPFSPEPLPIYLIICSRGTHTSRSPSNIKIGGITRSIVLD